MRELTQDRARCRRMGEAGPAYIARFHSVAVRLDQIEEMLAPTSLTGRPPMRIAFYSPFWPLTSSQRSRTEETRSSWNDPSLRLRGPRARSKNRLPAERARPLEGPCSKAATGRRGAAHQEGVEAVPRRRMAGLRNLAHPSRSLRLVAETLALRPALGEAPMQVEAVALRAGAGCSPSPTDGRWRAPMPSSRRGLGPRNGAATPGVSPARRPVVAAARGPALGAAAGASSRPVAG